MDKMLIPNQHRSSSLLWYFMVVGIVSASVVVYLFDREPLTRHVESGLTVQVQQALAQTPPEDRRFIWAMFEAGAEYLRSGHPGTETTEEWFSAWELALKNSGWTEGSVPGLTDALEDELRTRGYSQSRQLDECAEDLASIYESVSRGALP